MSQAQRDRTRAGANVDDGRLRSVSQPGRCPLDEDLSLRPGDEHAGTNLEPNPHELSFADEVRHRGTTRSLFEQVMKGSQCVRVDWLLEPSEQLGAIDPQDVPQEHLGIESWSLGCGLGKAAVAIT